MTDPNPMTDPVDAVERVRKVAGAMATHVLHFALRNAYGRDRPQDQFAADLEALLAARDAALEEWGKLALDLNTYTGHDDDCMTNVETGACSCGLSELSRKLTVMAEGLVADLAAATQDQPAQPSVEKS